MNKIQIQNFQGHKSSELILNPDGVNIIKGTSNSGKSSIIRALNWLILNRPRGFGFRSNFASNKDLTKISVDIDGNTIIRERNDVKGKSAINFYRIIKDDEEIFSAEALNSEVPEEIQKALNLSTLNIQNQHDPFFMLQDGAGERGRMLNDFCNLSVIHEVTSKVESLMRKTKQILSVKEEQSKELNIKYNNFPDYEKYIPRINEIEEKEIKLEKKIDDLYELNSLYEKYIELENELNNFIDYKKIIEKIYGVLDLIKDYQYIKNQLNELNILIKKYKQYKIFISSINLPDDFENKTKEIFESINKLNELEIIENNLIALYYESVSCKETINKLSNQIEIAETKLSKTLKELGVCPLCGAKQ